MLANDIQIRDPFILAHDDKYYMFGSTDKDIWYSEGVGFDAYSSDDLVNWEGPFHAFRPSVNFWGKMNFWAPEVYAYKGSFYMFASFLGDGINRGTAILKAECPTGPFIPHSNGAVTPKEWMCLDGTFYIDENNDPFIIFCHEWIQTGDGTICVSRLKDDLSETISEPVTLFASSSAKWSAKAFSPSNNIEGYVTDGCYMYKMKNNKLLMLWSCVGENGYCIGYAISESGNIFGPWKQSENPLFSRDGGHGMIFRTYDDKLMLSIHSPNKTPNERAVFIELNEMENGLSIKNTFNMGDLL